MTNPMREAVAHTAIAMSLVDDRQGFHALLDRLDEQETRLLIITLASAFSMMAEGAVGTIHRLHPADDFPLTGELMVDLTLARLADHR
jgi:hypothetical protein